MKRRFTLIITALMLMITTIAWGQTRTQINWVAAEQGYENSETIEDVTFDASVSAAFYKGTNNNAPKYYNTGAAIRCYGGNYFTVTTASGNLTEIVMTFASGEGTNAITTDVGTYANGTWSGSATSVTFTIGGTSGHRRIAAFDITYSSSGQQNVSTPTFSPASGTYYNSVDVEIACSTEGATIYYTLDGTTPTTTSSVYTSPIEITATTTVKALGAKDGYNNSNVATATYTIETPPTLITIEEAKALEVNEYALVQGIITFIDGRNVYVQDETAGICLYLNSAVSTLALGDEVQAYGKRAEYNGLIELSYINPNDAFFSVLSSGNTLPLEVVTIADIFEDYGADNDFQSTRVQIVEATVGTINTGGNTPITQDGFSINIYKMPAVEDLVEGDIVNVTGVIGCFNNPQLRVALASDVEIQEPQPIETVATPTFSPEEGTYNDEINVTIACETEGATIYYTVDGTDPTTASAVYSYAITIDESTTVKAFGVKEGYNDSEIATAVYTIDYFYNVNVAGGIENGTIEVDPETATAGTTITVIATPDENYFLATLTYSYDETTNNIDQNTMEFVMPAADVTVNATFSMIPTVAAPTFTPAEGTYNEALVVTIACATEGATIYYTLDGSDPTSESEVYTNPIGIEETTTVKAFAAKEDMLDSGITTAVYTIEYYYNVTIAAGITNGTVAADPTIAMEGATITVTATPADGYELTMLTYTYDEITDDIDPETMQFVMPAADVTLNAAFTLIPTLTATPEALTGFRYTEGEGPSDEQELTITGAGLNEPVLVILSTDAYEMSLTPGTGFGIDAIELTPVAGSINQTVYVRLGADHSIGTYLGEIYVSSQLDDIIIELSGVVVEPLQPSDYTRLSDVSQLVSGAKVIFAARFNENANEYYAMTNTIANKIDGELFTSTTSTSGDETLPSVIADNEELYYWTVSTDGTNFTFTNDEGGVLGYSSGTNFTTGGDNTAWTIELGTSDEGSMVPDYDAFLVTNANSTGRAFALNNTYHSFGAYSKTNMSGSNAPGYNFFLDMFATAGSGQQYCAMPTFTPAAGTYFEAQNVTISCATEDATIYYTLDETTPTTSSDVYTEPIVISETTTIKAMAVKAGYENSSVATAVYTIEEPPTVITIAEAKALELNEYAMVQGIVTFVDGRNVYAQDETAGIVLYLNANTVPAELAAGDLVQAYGKRSVYNGLIELSGIDGSSSSDFSIISSGNDLPLETVTIAEILEDFAADNMLQSTRVEIVEATIGAINTAGSTPISQNGSDMTIYKIPVVEGLVEGDIVTFVGVIGCYNNPQMRIASADDIEFYHPTQDPVLVASTAALSGFSHIDGNGPSEAQTFTISGENLPPAPGSETGSVTITVNNGFEISLDGEIYTGYSITIPDVVGTLEQTQVYVRLNGETAGTYQGIVTIEDYLEVSVALSGVVLADGIDETLASSVSVWNNVNELMISNNSCKMLDVIVYNIVGQPVLRESVTTGSSTIRHNLADGVYIVRIADGKEMTGVKVVVNR